MPETELQENRSTPRSANGVTTRGPLFGYIGSTSFSGSTLLSFLLNAQAGIVSVGELSWSIPKLNPGKFPCSCGATIDDCPFWTEVSHAMRRRGRTFDAEHWNTAFDISTQYILRKLAVRPLGSNTVEAIRDVVVRNVPAWGLHLRDVGKQNLALVESISEVSNASVFVDASKDPTRVRFLRAYSEVEPYVVHLVRDSPGFVTSFTKHVKSSDAFRTAIRWWNWTVGRMERLRRTTSPQRWLRVRYEDLCENPNAEVERVIAFFNVARRTPVVAFRSTPHHIIGNRMRLGDSSEIRADNAWQTQLSREQLSEILAKTRSNRKLMGYTDEDTLSSSLM